MRVYCISSTAQRISFASVEEDKGNLLPHNDPLPETIPNLNNMRYNHLTNCSVC